MRRKISALIWGLVALWPASLLASTYGSGTYGSGVYNLAGQTATPAPTVIHVGPVILPITGSTLLLIIGAALIAIGAGTFVWLHDRRKSAAQA